MARTTRLLRIVAAAAVVATVAAACATESGDVQVELGDTMSAQSTDMDVELADIDVIDALLAENPNLDWQRFTEATMSTSAWVDPCYVVNGTPGAGKCSTCGGTNPDCLAVFAGDLCLFAACLPRCGPPRDCLTIPGQCTPNLSSYCLPPP